MNIITTVKHSGDGVMVGDYVAGSGPKRLVIIDGTMNSAHGQNLKKKSQKSVCDLEQTYMTCSFAKIILAPPTALPEFIHIVISPTLHG